MDRPTDRNCHPYSLTAKNMFWWCIVLLICHPCLSRIIHRGWRVWWFLGLTYIASNCMSCCMTWWWLILAHANLSAMLPFVMLKGLAVIIQRFKKILSVDPAAIHWPVCLNNQTNSWLLCVCACVFIVCLGNGMVSMAEKDDRYRRGMERWRAENLGHGVRDLCDFCQHKFTGA